MTTISMTFKGQNQDLEDALVFAIFYTSTRNLDGNTLKVSWICETDDEEKALQDCMDCVDIEKLGKMNISVLGI